MNSSDLEPYIALGYAFTPLKGKVPIRPGWQSEPPLTLTELSQYDGGNFGLRTGKISGVVVFDDDTLGFDEIWQPPITVTLETGSGKLHYYFEAQSLWPRFWAKEENEAARDYGTPWPLVIIASLVRNGFTSEEAWTMPESQAVWLHIANSQAAGAKINVITDKEWDAMENFRKNNKPPEPIK